MEKSLEENLKEAPPRFFMPLREKKKTFLRRDRVKVGVHLVFLF